MTSKPPQEPPTFERVARLIAEKKEDVDWLADGLRAWIWPEERWPSGARKFGSGLGTFAAMAGMRWSRAELIKHLKKDLPNAAGALSKMLADWALMCFLTDDRLGAGFGPEQQVALATLLHEIRRRCDGASRFPELVTPQGKAKPGRNKALAPGQIDEKAACAAVVMVAWKVARGKSPGPRVKRAHMAADLLFPLGMAQTGRFDQVKTPLRSGDDVLAAWPRHFRAARRPNAVLDRINKMLEETLLAAREHLRLSALKVPAEIRDQIPSLPGAI
jgi:hypothetical protein